MKHLCFSFPLKGGIGSIFDPPKGKDYKWYTSGIYCQLGDYMPPSTFYRNQKQPLKYIDPDPLYTYLEDHPTGDRLSDVPYIVGIYGI